MAHSEGRPLGDLVGGLFSDLSGLFHKEVQLAKAEASEKASELVQGAVLVFAGGVLAIGALGVFLAMLVAGLGAIFVGMGMDSFVASTVASLIVTAVVGLIAWTVINRGLARLSADKLQLEKTTHSLAEDARVVKEAL